MEVRYGGGLSRRGLDPPRQLSRKLLSILDRLGCLSFRSALASIWRMRSRVTENCWLTSSSVWSLFMPMPKRMRKIRSSRGVSDASTRVVVSRGGRTEHAYVEALQRAPWVVDTLAALAKGKRPVS